jgi:succinate dehydrogenase / fumarate reductase cytochrome b subunit
MPLTSILKKVAMAFTGLALFGFVVVHLSGNFLLFGGSKPFNAYADKLKDLGALLYLAEVGLILFFAVHIYSGIRVSLENRRARPTPYAVKATAGSATLASRTMAIGGIILAFFVITHVKMFKFGDASQAEGLWGLVIHTFHNPLMVAWYLLAMGALGLHLSHGFSSAFQTLGAHKPAWRARLRSVGFALGWLIAIGFSSLPIWSFFHADPIH